MALYQTQPEAIVPEKQQQQRGEKEEQWERGEGTVDGTASGKKRVTLILATSKSSRKVIAKGKKRKGEAERGGVCNPCERMRRKK